MEMKRNTSFFLVVLVVQKITISKIPQKKRLVMSDNGLFLLFMISASSNVCYFIRSLFLRMCAGRNLAFLFLFGLHFLHCRLPRLYMCSLWFLFLIVYTLEVCNCFKLALTVESLLFMYQSQNYTTNCSTEYWVLNLLQVLS